MLFSLAIRAHAISTHCQIIASTYSSEYSEKSTHSEVGEVYVQEECEECALKIDKSTSETERRSPTRDSNSRVEFGGFINLLQIKRDRPDMK